MSSSTPSHRFRNHERHDHDRRGCGARDDRPTADAELARRFAAADETAVRELYRRFGARVFASAMRVHGDRTLAEEATQETFVRAWRRARSFDPARAIEPWLFRIARNVAIDQARARGRRPIATHGSDPEPMLHAIADERIEARPDAVAEHHDLRSVVRLAIARLPDGEAEVVRLQHLHGLTHTEIAVRLDISPGTVKSRSHRAHRRLAADLADQRSGAEDDPEVVPEAVAVPA